MSHEYTYDPSQPGTAKTGLPGVDRVLANDGWGMDADTVTRLMQLKQQVIAENTATLEKAYVEHENVLRSIDLTIKFLERVADTPDLRKELDALRAHRETLDRLLFWGGQELHKDESTWRV